MALCLVLLKSGGTSLAIALEAQSFHVTATNLVDRELAFDGPASTEILEAWRARF